MNIRIRFSKQGNVKFIGHLDILRYFQKALRRAGVDMKYSQGYHPHPYLSFASPLGVGLESFGEYLDIEVNHCDDLQELWTSLQGQMAEGIDVMSVHALPDGRENAMSIIAAADYRIIFRPGMCPAEAGTLNGKIQEFLSLENITIIKKTKKSEREMDIKPLIYEMSADAQDVIFMRLAAGSVNNLKPELVIQAMCDKLGLAFEENSLMMTRLELYASRTDEQGEQLISLENYGLDEVV